MKKLYLLVIFGVMIFGKGKGQNLIAVQNGGVPTFYKTLDLAITNAQSGDTLYLPGGSFPLSAPISQQIHIIGVGHNPDSTIAKMPTYITSNIYLTASTSGGSMTGINVTGIVYFGPFSAAENYTIFRCKIDEISSERTYSWSCAPKNNKFYENVIGTLNFAGGESNVFCNNIFIALGRIGSFNIIKNNLFLSSNYPISTGYNSIISSIFENNIFIATSTIYSLGSNYFSNNIFSNNMFVENISFPYLSTNMGPNNLVNQTQESIFVNQSGNNFNFTHDYHLKPDSPGKNAGKDGTDIGIYGGAFPWKEGSIPSNPHFQKAQISPTTDTNDNLNVKIKVAAQEH